MGSFGEGTQVNFLELKLLLLEHRHWNWYLEIRCHLHSAPKVEEYIGFQ